MGTLRQAVVFACPLLLAGASYGGAPEASQQEMRSLDEQVQEIKSDVLGIAADLDALQHGGVQRIFTGNFPTGAHQIAISVNGKTQLDKVFNHTETFEFSKGVEPKLLGITLAGPEAIQLGDW